MSINNIREEIENRLRRMEYTSEYSEEVKKTHNTGCLLTSEEHSQMSEQEWGDAFHDKDEYVRWYFNYLSNSKKLDALGVALDFCINNKVKNILSLGAGPGVLEYFLSEMIGVDIVVADYDRYLCEKAKDFFGSEKYKSVIYDFYKDDLSSILTDNNIDFIIMFGSSCSMDDDTYSRFLKGCNEMKVPYLLLFEAGVCKNQVYRKRWLSIAKQICREKLLRQHKVYTPVAIHAWYRSEKILHKIYNNSGYEWTRLPRLKTYSNVYILRLK